VREGLKGGEIRPTKAKNTRRGSNRTRELVDGRFQERTPMFSWEGEGSSHQTMGGKMEGHRGKKAPLKKD